MALPPPIRGFRSKHINALLKACLANTPLAGIGVSVRRTPNGTVINAEVGDGEVLDYRFKVTVLPTGEGDLASYNLHIRKGSLYTVEGEVASEVPLALDGLEQDPDDADAWRVANASAGSLYIRKETGSTGGQGYTLAYGEPSAALFVIADFTPSVSSSNPEPKLTQRLLGDRYAFKGGSGGGLTVGPPELITENGENALAWFAGTVAWAGDNYGYRFTRATKPDGSPAEPLFTLPIVAHRKDHAPGIPYTES